MTDNRWYTLQRLAGRTEVGFLEALASLKADYERDVEVDWPKMAKLLFEAEAKLERIEGERDALSAIKPTPGCPCWCCHSLRGLALDREAEVGHTTEGAPK